MPKKKARKAYTVPSGTILKAIEALLGRKAYQATMFVSPDLRVTASRRLYHGKLRNGFRLEVLITIDKPNYRQHLFVNDCIKAKVKFPIKDAWLRFPPKQR